MTKLFNNTFGSANNKKQRLSIAAGKSGGHILPAIQLAKEWLKKHIAGTVETYCSHKQLDANLYAQHGMSQHLYAIKLAPFSLKKAWQLPLLACQILYHTIAIAFRFAQHKPTEVISTGGIEALPVCLAARLHRIPITLYELNVEPGKAVTFLAPLATTIHTVFEGTKKHLARYADKCHMAPYPLRFTGKATPAKKATAQKTLFILGGSQGSQFLNNLARSLVTTHKNIASNMRIIHQVGARDVAQWQTFYQKHGIQAEVFGFSNEIEKHYHEADVVLSRAGAGTLFELLFFEKRSIIIPLQAASTLHQAANAKAMEHKRPDLFTVLEQGSVEQTMKSVMKACNALWAK